MSATPSVSAGEISLLLDVVEFRIARVHECASAFVNSLRLSKVPDALLAQRRRYRLEVGEMRTDRVEPDRAAGQESAGARRIGILQHALELVGRGAPESSTQGMGCSRQISPMASNSLCAPAAAALPSRAGRLLAASGLSSFRRSTPYSGLANSRTLSITSAGSLPGDRHSPRCGSRCRGTDRPEAPAHTGCRCGGIRRRSRARTVADAR